MGFQGSYSTCEDYEGLAEVCSHICVGLYTRGSIGYVGLDQLENDVRW